MAGVGHNLGPTMEPGYSWRKTCWTKSRKALLPRMPIEVIRTRIRRAKEIGLDYKTYASVRATSGRDVVAFLFSSNALRLHLAAADLPEPRAEKLRGLKHFDSMIIAHRPLKPSALIADFKDLHDITLRAARAAPLFTESWSETRARLTKLLHDEKIPGDAILLVGETAIEREWLAAGKFAGYIAANRYFSESMGPG